MNNLLAHIKKYIEINSSEEEIVLSKVKIQSFKKKEILESHNTVHNRIFFVNNGLLHLYQITEKGNEQTIQFAIKDWWLTDFDSFNPQKESMYNIQAVEESEAVVLHHNDFEYLLSEVPKLERYFRLVTQRAYAASLNRISLIFNSSKEDIYLNFVKKYPEFVQQVPQYILASFLGISAEYISEIRKNQSKNLS